MAGSCRSLWNMLFCQCVLGGSVARREHSSLLLDGQEEFILNVQVEQYQNTLVADCREQRDHGTEWPTTETAPKSVDQCISNPLGIRADGVSWLGCASGCDHSAGWS